MIIKNIIFKFLFHLANIREKLEKNQKKIRKNSKKILTQLPLVATILWIFLSKFDCETKPCPNLTLIDSKPASTANFCLKKIRKFKEISLFYLSVNKSIPRTDVLSYSFPSYEKIEYLTGKYREIFEN